MFYVLFQLYYFQTLNKEDSMNIKIAIKIYSVNVKKKTINFNKHLQNMHKRKKLQIFRTKINQHRYMYFYVNFKRKNVKGNLSHKIVYTKWSGRKLLLN